MDDARCFYFCVFIISEKCVAQDKIILIKNLYNFGLGLGLGLGKSYLPHHSGLIDLMIFAVRSECLLSFT